MIQPPVESPARTAAIVIASLLGLCTVFLLTAVLVHMGAPKPQRQDQPQRRTINELRAADQEALSTYGWVDESNGIVRIPIEAAMERVIAESRRPTTRPRM